jgi:predicted metal-dependent HD superfamily phosphohydrolase
MEDTEDKIKQAILHPQPHVRDFAIRYFTRSQTQDASIFLFVLQAIKEYGGEDAFSQWIEFIDLPVSEETLLATLALVQSANAFPKSDTLTTRKKSSLLGLSLNTETDVLWRHQSKLRDHESFTACQSKYLKFRLDLRKSDSKTCWSRLKKACKSADRRQEYPDETYIEAVTAAIVRHGDAAAALRELQAVQQAGWTFESNPSSETSRLDEAIIEIAGAMGIEAATPILLDALRATQGTPIPVNDACLNGLVRIGSDAVVEGAYSLFVGGVHSQRVDVNHILRGIHSDLAVARLIKLLSLTDNPVEKAVLAIALTSQAKPECIELVHQLILSGDLEDDEDDLTSDLIADLSAAALILGVDLPEQKYWIPQIELRRQADKRAEALEADDDSDEPYAFYEDDDEGYEDDDEEGLRGR